MYTFLRLRILSDGNKSGSWDMALLLSTSQLN